MNGLDKVTLQSGGPYKPPLKAQRDQQRLKNNLYTIQSFKDVYKTDSTERSIGRFPVSVARIDKKVGIITRRRMNTAPAYFIQM